MQQCEFWSLCAQMCIHHVGRAWIWGAELGGWRRTEGLGWLACDYSGCQVFTERWGGAKTAAFTLYLKPHTYTHSHLHGRLELYWKPHKPSSVYVCLCYSWPLGLVAKTDRLTHIRSPKYSWTWCRLNGCETCGCWLTRSAKKNNAMRVKGLNE